MVSPVSIVWFSNDLRVSDAPALTAAAARGAIVPLFILDESLPLGGASKIGLADALASLAAELAKRGLSLTLRRGDPLTILRNIIAATGATAVYWSRRYEPALAERDAAIETALLTQGIETITFPGFLLLDPGQIRTKSGDPFKVFTPFSKACFAAMPSEPPLPAPKKMQAAATIPSDRLADWHLEPDNLSWPQGLRKSWTLTEAEAHARLALFLTKKLAAYPNSRDIPAIDGTSRLSPYLHFGLISPRQIWHAAAKQSHGADKFLTELLWREFSWHLLINVPTLPHQPLQKSFAAFPWRQDEKQLRAWQRGLTGYPIVDAGMRQLWQTGWMHNRVRMIVASFLIKDMLIDWRQGEAWFWDTLIDADLAANSASWQWVAGCGADAAPYFRIFNPVLQGQKFDPKGDYVRAFVPELAKLEAKYIHAPWLAPAEALTKAGIKYGESYPLPVLDHAAARKRALNALKISKGEGADEPKTGNLFD